MADEYTAAYCVCRGSGKNECDDTALLKNQPLNETQGTFSFPIPGWAALMDGVGGNAGGKHASVLIAEYLTDAALPASEEEMTSLMLRANSALLDAASRTPEHHKMATTATVLAFEAEGSYLAHIGNTRLWQLRSGYLQQLTADQTNYQYLLDIGQTEAAEHCNKSVIRGALGGGSTEPAGLLKVSRVFEKKLPALLMFTTDGVHEYVSQDEMESILNGEGTLIEKAALLCQKALEAGSEDDRSVVLLKNEN